MRILFLSLLFVGSASIGIGQPNDSVPDGFAPNPYRNEELHKDYNPAQVDFSKEYFAFQWNGNESLPDMLAWAKDLDGSNVWLSGDREQNGVLGKDYTRIRFHIDEVQKDTADSLRACLNFSCKGNQPDCQQLMVLFECRENESLCWVALAIHLSHRVIKGTWGLRGHNPPPRSACLPLQVSDHT